MANFSPRRSGGPFGNFGGSAHGPILTLPPMTQILILSNLGIHLLRQFRPDTWDNWLVFNFGFIPARYTNLELFNWTALLGPISSQFLHGGLMTMIFATAVERTIGGRPMMILALLSGALGCALHFLIYFGDFVAAIGFSGATSGLFGATLRLMNRRQSGRDSRQLWIFAAIWVGLSLLPALSGGGVAWAVHIGGFLAGLLLIDYFNRPRRFRVM
jgi:membrane associated rhomboid family serine protease